MKTNVLKTTTAPPYACSADCHDLRERIDGLFEEVIASSLSTDALAQSLSSGLAEVGTILRSIPGHEGRLLERGLAMIARCNPHLVVLTQNLRMPVTPAALQLVEKNAPEHYRTLTLDADHGGRKTYTPDMLILNRRTKLAHIIDVKRSLLSYESTRIDDLKSRMLAAALVVPDLLYKEHRRLVAEEVRVVILSGDDRKCDIDGGIWPFSHLDHLFEISGAGEAIGLLKRRFDARINKNWEQARQVFARPSNRRGDPLLPVTIAGEETEPDDEEAEVAGEDAATAIGNKPRLIKLGFARVPARH